MPKCLACLESDHFAFSECCFKICELCLLSGLKSRVASSFGLGINNLKCPICATVLSDEFLGNFLDPPTFQKYTAGKNFFSEASENDRRRHECPDCKEVIENPADHTTEGVIECPNCYTDSCLECGGLHEYHCGISCEEYLAWRSKNYFPINSYRKNFGFYFPQYELSLEDSFDEAKEQAMIEDEFQAFNWKMTNTRKCSNCCYQIEKNGGCNHMTCGICRFQFCWLCEFDCVERIKYSSTKACTHSVYRRLPTEAGDDDIGLGLFD